MDFDDKIPVVNSLDDVSVNSTETNQKKSNGISIGTTVVFLIGEVAGSGLLALPYAIGSTGLIGVPLLLFCCLISGYNGVNLGRCWNILQERYPEYRQHVSAPYPSIGEKAVGKWMRVVVSVCINLTLFGSGTVFILLISQNLQSLFCQLNFNLSVCYWILIVVAILIPFSWLGTPKDFWLGAVGAALATFSASVLIFAQQILDIDVHFKNNFSPTHKPPTFTGLFLAFGTLLFAYGGLSTFPTIQSDMKTPKKFSVVVVLAYIAIFAMYIPVSLGGYFVYGDSVKNNILQSLSPGPLRITAEILITAHLFFAFVILINPVSQEFEGLFKAPKRFHWKRCLIRTVILLCALFVAETVPHFGPILDLIGGSTITFLTFIAPSLFYLRLCSLRGDWPEVNIPLHVKVLNIEIILVGLVGGIASTYSGINELIAGSTFTLPCFISLQSNNCTLL